MLLAILASIATARVYFEETFDRNMKRWKPATWQSAETMAPFVRTTGAWSPLSENYGIQTTEDLRFHAISAKLDRRATTVGKDLVVQFTVKHEKHEYNFCGGGYLKLFSARVYPRNFGGDTPYAIMFGPDICSYDTAKIHVIFSHGGVNLDKTSEIKLDYNDKNKLTHLYTLYLKADGTYEVWLDAMSKASGSYVLFFYVKYIIFMRSYN